jgi:predicted nucleotidyltransferase
MGMFSNANSMHPGKSVFRQPAQGAMSSHAADRHLDMARAIVLGILPPEEFTVFLFGSRSQGRARADSDIDIGILGHRPLGRYKYQIIDALEESTIPCHFDLVEFRNVDPSFRDIATQSITLWHQAPSLPIK